MTDEEARTLERAAKAGDLEAERRLVAVRARQGRPRFTITQHAGTRSRHSEGPAYRSVPIAPNVAPAIVRVPSMIEVGLDFVDQPTGEAVPGDVLDVVRLISRESPTVALIHDHEAGKSYLVAQLGRFMPPVKPWTDSP